MLHGVGTGVHAGCQAGTEITAIYEAPGSWDGVLAPLFVFDGSGAMIPACTHRCCKDVTLLAVHKHQLLYGLGLLVAPDKPSQTDVVHHNEDDRVVTCAQASALQRGAWAPSVPAPPIHRAISAQHNRDIPW